MNRELLRKIQSRGYWRVNFHPLSFKRDKISKLIECVKIIQDCYVQLRGWSYPFFREELLYEGGINYGQDYIETEIDFQHHKELWRFYQSAQFIHYRALWEDWYENEIWFDERSTIPTPREIISVEGVIYLLTEIFEFIKRLAKKEIYNEGLKLVILLVNTENRRLANTNYEKSGFYNEYKTTLYQINFEKIYYSDDIIIKSNEYAYEAISHFFERFKWFPPIKNIQEIQKSFLGRRS